jgi:hypothetical protein
MGLMTGRHRISIAGLPRKPEKVEIVAKFS